MPYAMSNLDALTGSTITAHGLPDITSDTIVLRACSNLHKLAFAPVRFRHRTSMCASAALPTAAMFGTELLDITKGQRDKLRVGTMAR